MRELREIHEKLQILKEPYCLQNFSKRNAYKSCLIASFSKSIELGYSFFNEEKEEGAYFKTASLRGICEEIIVLKYIGQKLHPHQNEIVLQQLQLNLAKDLVSQENFFKNNHPFQPILNSKLYSDMATPTNAIKSILSQKGVNGNKLPPVEQMAQVVELSELYSYMYRATSNFVHFNPGHLMRMGWGKSLKEITFKPTNFYKYYMRFNQFYISYLITVLCTTFKQELKLKGEIWKLIKKLQSELDRYLTWPEIVTFEEMNIKRPSEILTALHISMSKLSGG